MRIKIMKNNLSLLFVFDVVKVFLLGAGVHDTIDHSLDGADLRALFRCEIFISITPPIPTSVHVRAERDFNLRIEDDDVV